MILDSEKSFRRTAGTEADSCLSISCSWLFAVGKPTLVVGPERAGLPISVLAEFPIIEIVAKRRLERRRARGSIKAPDRRVPWGRPEDARVRPGRLIFVRAVRPNSFRPAPWGRKRYFAPLPVLSVLLLATVIANPDILKTDFLLYQDSGLSIVARVSQVVHLSGPSGTTIGTSPGRPPFSVDAGSTVSVPFKGSFSGDLTSLSVGQQFSVTPTVSWMEVYSTGNVGPFSYTQPKTCTIPSVIVPSPVGGQWVAICA